MEQSAAKYLFVEGKDDVDFFNWLKTTQPKVMGEFTIQPLEGKDNGEILANHLNGILKKATPAWLYFLLDSDGNPQGSLKRNAEALLSRAIGTVLNQPIAAVVLDISGWNRLEIKGLEIHIAACWIESKGEKRPIHELEDLLFHLLPPNHPHKASDCFENQWIPCLGDDYISAQGITRKDLNKRWDFILRHYDLSRPEERKKEDSWAAVLARHPDLFDPTSALLTPYLTFFQTQPTP